MTTRHTSKKQHAMSIHFQDEDIKALFHKYLQKFPQAIKHLIDDMKDGKLSEKIIRLEEPDGILRFFVDNHSICIEHRLDVSPSERSRPYGSLPKKKAKTAKTDPQTPSPFGSGVRDQIESSLEEDY